MPIYYATFPPKYSDNSHPTLPAAHPDGYLTINATSETEASAKVQSRIADDYSMIYTAPDFDKSLYPLGSIATI